MHIYLCMGSIIEIIIIITIASISSWYYNIGSQPKEIYILNNNLIETYVYSPKYSCPYICEVNHIHFATDSLYKKRLNK